MPGLRRCPAGSVSLRTLRGISSHHEFTNQARRGRAGFLPIDATLMIELTDVRFTWPGDPYELHVPQLQLAAGRSVAITGRSGCGKTTLLNLLSGILLPTSGRICVGHVCINHLPEAARRDFRLRTIGLVFQDFQLLDYLHVLDNVLLPCRLSTTVRLTTDLRERALWLLQHVGLAHAARRSVTRLSQGERQRVAICRALLLSPQVILADEPTGNLDPDTADQILQLLLTQARLSQATLVMVTHDATLLPAFDRVLPFDACRARSASATVEATT